MYENSNECVFQQQIYLNRGFGLNRCTQRSISQTPLEVFLDLGQPELQVNSLCLFNPTGFIQPGHTLIQGGLPTFCPTKSTQDQQ